MSGEQTPETENGNPQKQLTTNESASMEGGSSEQWLGITRDVVNAGSTGADVGFNIARQSTKMGFRIATFGLNALSRMGNRALPSNPISATLSGVSGIIDCSWKITDASLQASHVITTTSLGTTSGVLGACGAKDGELLKAMGVDSDTIDALVVVAKIINDVCQGIELSPYILDDLALIASIQSLAGMKIDPSDSNEVDENERREITKYLPYAMSIYGKFVSRFLGIQDHIPNERNVRAEEESKQKETEEEIEGNADDIAFIAQMCKIEAIDIIAHKWKTCVYDPSFFITIDRRNRAVVVTFRGTLSIGDTLTNLLCEHEPYEIFGTKGKVHIGFGEAAKRLAPRLEPLIGQGLGKLISAEYDRHLPLSLILTGHSLGGAVATTLAVHWLASGSFRGIRLRCYSYAAPCVFSFPLASHSVLKDSICSVVIGDDMVPRFGHGSAWEVRGRVLRLQELRANSPQQYQNLLDMVSGDNKMSRDSAAATYTLLAPEEEPKERLYPAGSVYYANPFDENEHRQIRLMHLPHDHLADMLLSRNMLSDHMPQSYARLVPLYGNHDEMDQHE